MFTKKEGVTNLKHLIDTILKHTSLQTTREFVEGLVCSHLECAEEIYKDGVLVGYFLLFSFCGSKSFHGYKLIEGYGVRAFRYAKEFIAKHKASSLETTTDQTKVVRIAKMLGFLETRRVSNLIAFGRTV